jgi:hypothetical protein
MLIDVAINYYGKPYHTMVAIGSLLEHSGAHIDKVFLIKEAKQPEGGGVITELLGRHDWNVEVFTPRYYLGWKMYRTLFPMRRREFRWSIRYEYALERTDKRYVFLTHNDVLFLGDVLRPMLDLIAADGHAGVGDIGACWKCPAKAASLCDAHRPAELRLTHAEAVELYERFPSPHRRPNVSLLDRRDPVPFPECRLNEWLALLDAEAYRRNVKPQGDTEPIGSVRLGDTGVAWFRSMIHKGYSFAHVEGPFRHPWTIDRGDRSLYESEEAVAEQYYLEHYASR